ncbi:hypothetical protein GCM10009808_09940 [Microbacterium sediminicola]|uniref:histidine kinase n=1 Tax=Microbacterium sediminicola TaxID=415210 RepID=A0ABN2HWT8_9MICO
MSTGQLSYLRATTAPVRRASPWWMWLVVIIAIFVASRAGIAFTPPESPVAAWWPAAGIAAWFALMNPRSRLWAVTVMVVIVTAAANAVGGRDPITSVAFGFANALEIVVFALMLARRGDRRFLLRTIPHAWRFALATLAASTVLGLLVGLIVVIGGGDFAEVTIHVTASHAAAIAMIAPFAALAPRLKMSAPRVEVVAQIVVLCGTLTLLAVSEPGLPLAFVVVGLLAWGSYRLPMWGAISETLLTGIAMLAFTVGGVGPFSSSALSPVAQTTVLAFFLLITGLYNLFLSTSSYELLDANRASRNYAELLTGGFLDSRVGLVIVERAGRTWHVLLANPAAQKMLQREVDGHRRWLSGPIRARAEASLRNERFATFETPDGLVLNLDVSPVTGDPSRVAVQIFDITASVQATQAQLIIERERSATMAARLELDRRQEDFVATASHELRTPITSISGYIELLEEEPDLTDQAREWIQVIDRNTVRLRGLVEDLLALSRATDRSELTRAVERISGHDLIDEVVCILNPVAAERGVTLTVGDCAGEVMGVRAEIVRALGNLASNAVKFTPRGGEVTLESASDEILQGADAAPRAGTRLTVTDTGPGIDTDVLEHVFERFYRAPEAEKESTPGTGLGLAIARELALNNGGTVELASKPGHGVRATLLLPAPTSEPAPASDPEI